MAKKSSTTAKKTTTRKRSTTAKKTSATRGGTSKRSSSSKKTTKKPSTRKSSTTKRRVTPKKKQPEPRFSLNSQQKALMVGIFLIFTTAILLLSLLSINQGRVTTALGNWMWSWFGWGGVVIPFIMGGAGLYLVMWGMDHPPKLPTYRLLGGGLLYLAFEAVATIIVLVRSNVPTTVWEIATERVGGGYLGAVLSWLAIVAVGPLGAAFLFLLLAFIGLVLVSGISRAEMGASIRRLLERQPRPQRESPSKKDDDVVFEPARTIPVNPAPLAEPEPTASLRPVRIVSRDKTQAKDEEDIVEAIRRKRRAKQTKKKEAAPSTPQPTVPAMIKADSKEGSWTLPVLDKMLNPGTDPDMSFDSIREQAEVIEHTLESFGAPGKIVDINSGPTVTQFGVEPLYLEARNGRRTKVKVSKIAGLADDLALALAAKSVRIQAPVPGKGYIGVEVPNTAKVVVSLRDTMESQQFAKIKSPLRVGLGQDVAGNASAADLAKMPHLLIAGATGSGKSVCVNTIIASLLLQNTPHDLRFVMVDPKRVELTGYNGIPHLAAPVVVDMDRVVGVLQWALREMDQRYTTFATVGVRNINSYNKQMLKEGKEKLPYIVIIIDELADLMMTAPEDTERALARLAQMARATGIHMIIATQRPSVDVVTGLIKANFPARIAFAVSSSTDSRVVLDQTGAERLLGMGDMLFQRPDAPAPVRMQGCYVSDEELNKLISYWKTARRFFTITKDDATKKAEIPPNPAPLTQTQQPTVQRNGATRRTPSTTNEQVEEVVIRPKTTTQPTPQPQPTTKHPRPKRGKQTKPQVVVEPPAIPQEEPLAETVPVQPAPTPAPQPQVEEKVQQPLWEDLIDIEQQKKQSDAVDELWDDAVQFVRKSGKASTSMLQRRFRIGYTRAARIIDAMEDENIIGPPTGTSKAREVMPFSDSEA